MSISDYAEEQILNHTLGGAAFTQPPGVFIRLHVGDPSDTCTANAALNTQRQPVTFAPANNPAGTKVSNSQAQWVSVPNSEIYSHISLWSAATGGNPLWSGSLTTPVSVTAGGTFTIASGALTVTLD